MHEGSDVARLPHFDNKLCLLSGSLTGKYWSPLCDKELQLPHELRPSQAIGISYARFPRLANAGVAPKEWISKT
jgi:hypothetical protein